MSHATGTSSHSYEDTSALLRRIGPQREHDTPLARRIRFHQSWYRATVLERPGYGLTPGPLPRPLGSILAEPDARQGFNFTSKESQRLYDQRRSEGWGLDPSRCTKIMTSSQALTLNLMGPLSEHHQWRRDVVRVILGRSEIEAVTGIHIEFAPLRPSHYLGDKTRIDVLLTMDGPAGSELLAIEVKYADRFNSRAVNINTQRYLDLASRTHLWKHPEATLSTALVNQLVRCHALAYAVTPAMTGTQLAPTLLGLHHDEDANARHVVSSYQDHLAQPELALGVTLDALVTAMEVTATTPHQKGLAAKLRARYAHDGASEEAWRASQPPGRSPWT